MTLEEALVIGEVLQIEVPTSAGPIQAELANVCFARDLDRAQKQWRRLVERLASLQKATYDLVDSSVGIRLKDIADVKASGGTGDQKLLSLAQGPDGKGFSDKEGIKRT
jgi:hypothetical protein